MADYLWHRIFQKKGPPRLSEAGPKRNKQLLQPSEPGVNLFAGLVFSIAVALLETTLQLVALAGDRGEIIISHFAPRLLDLAFYLFPRSFSSVPVHGCML